MLDQQSTNHTLTAISFAEAQKLTNSIRTAADNLWQLIQQAHDQRAWEAMGYGSWKSYVQTEFGMSPRRSYQLLAQAEVINALEDASGPRSTLQRNENLLTPMTHASEPRFTPQITEREARRIRPRLGEAREFVRQKIEDGVQPEEAVQQAVKTFGRAVEEAAIELASDPIPVLARVISAIDDLRLAWPVENIAPAIVKVYGVSEVRAEVFRLRQGIDHLHHIGDVMESYLEI